MQIYENHKCTAVEETNIESILAAINTTKLVVEVRPEKKIETQTGYKPRTSVIPLQRYRFKFCRGLNFFQTLFQLRSSVLVIAARIDSIFVY